MKTSSSSLGTFHWHNASQCGGALNDNLFKLAVIYALPTAWSSTTGEYQKAVVSALFAIPFLIFIGAAGVLADRVSKNKITCGIKVAEILVMAFGAAAIALGNVWMLLTGIFLMSVQSSFFSPTKFGIIPELVGRENLSKANSQMQAASYLAIILGTILAPILSNRLGKWTGLASVVVAILGWLAALKIEKTPVRSTDAKASVFFIKDIYTTLKFIHRDGYLSLAAWASAFFLMIAAYIQLNLLTYGTKILNMKSDEEATFLFVVVALGIGIGSLVAGKVSRRGIEFGVLPLGALLMALSCFGLSSHPGELISYLLCGSMGFGAGLFVVPIQSFLQYRSPDDKMGEIIAASGWLSWLGVLVAAGLLYLTSTILQLNPAQGFLFIGVLILAMATVAFCVLPDFFVRFVATAITRVYYQMQWTGIRNLPSDGGALLVCNHVCKMDAIWLSAIMPRRIRFVMSREYISESSPWMQRLFKLGGVIPIHEDDGPKAILKAFQHARDAIEEGYLVAIFPEGKLSRTGHLLPFKPGFERIVKGTDAPIIPMFIEGGYGTYASYAHGLPKILAPGDFRHPVLIAIGEHLPTKTTTEEVENAVRELAATASDARAPYRGSAGQCFVRNAKANWNKKALADSSGKTLTYGKVLIGTSILRPRLAKGLMGDPEEVGVLLPPSVAGAIVNLSLVMDRRVPVNLNYTASPSAISSAMEQAGIQTVITSKKFMKKLPEIPLPDHVLFAEDLFANIGTAEKLSAAVRSKLLPAKALVPDYLWKPEDPLTILFSSGSTAQPKGIILSHHNILSNIDGFSTVARPQEEDCLCSVLPFFHSFGFTAGMWFPLTRGITVLYHHHPLETDAIGALAKEHDATILMGTPTFLTAWIRKIDPDSFTKLRWTVVGAEKLRTKVADMFERRFGNRPLEGYGATECSPVIAVNVPDLEIDGYCQQGTLEGSVGRPLPNLRVKVLDPDTEEPVEQGQTGLLWVKGPSVMDGYLKNPEKTEEVLKDGWYNTGDIVKQDENGFITITDRLTRFSKLAGEMVSHSAVEEALQKAVGCTPDKLAVTGIPDEKKGEKLVVVFAQELGDAADFQDAIRALDIPNLWKPDARNWVAVEALPTLGTGKLDLKGLKQVANGEGS